MAARVEPEIQTLPQRKPNKGELAKSNPESPLYYPQNPLPTYIELLARELKTSEKIRQKPELNPQKWTKTSYEILAQTISKELNEKLPPKQRLNMGTSLSYRTLRKIMLGDYKIALPIDPRTLNTLTKIVAFLGHENWNSFIAHADSQKFQSAHKLNPDEEVLEVVRISVHNEYKAYQQLPKPDASLLTTHLEDGPAFNLIMEVLLERKSRNVTISNPFNPSTYEILDIELKKLEPTYAQVYTREYWLLCWWDIQKNRYVKRYKNISEHFYILHKINNQWKVKTNASIADPMETITDTA
jgi:hypothetical protein